MRIFFLFQCFVVWRMDFILIILGIFVGICFGIFTGLFPGIHINLISVLILSKVGVLIEYFELRVALIAIVSMGIVHSFLDFIPSIILGVPDSDTSLSILPAHRMLISGFGYEAIFLSGVGSLGGMLFVLILSFIVYFWMEWIYLIISDLVVVWLLVISMIFMWMSESGWNKKVWAIVIIFFCSSFGMFILNSKFVSEPMLILFTGLFGISSLFYNLENSKNCSSCAKQEFSIVDVEYWGWTKSVVIGGFASFLCLILPGIGNAQAATISTAFFRDVSSKLFIVVTGAINTISFGLSFVVLYVAGKSRNGVMVVLGEMFDEFVFSDLVLVICVCLVVSVISFVLLLILGRVGLRVFEKLNLYWFNILLMLGLFFIVFLFDSWFGVLSLIGVSCLGLLAFAFDVKKVHVMSCIMVPVIFYYLI